MQKQVNEVKAKVTDTPRCKYHQLCRAFIQESFPNLLGFFNFAHDRCFCADCFTDEGDSYESGDSVSSYPKGFCRIGYNLIEAEMAQREDWCISYHGTEVRSNVGDMFSLVCCPLLLQLERMKNVIEGRGILLLPGQIRLGGRAVGSAHTDTKEVKLSLLSVLCSPLFLFQHEGRFFSPYYPSSKKIYFNPKAIFTSPSPLYAAEYAKDAPFTCADGKRYKVQCVFQLRQRPGSFHVHPETLLDAEKKHSLPHEYDEDDAGTKNAKKASIDPTIPDSQLEWFSKENAGISITGVLVRMTRQ